MVLELPKLSKELSLNWSGASYDQEKFQETIIYKIFETNSSFHVKWRTTAKL